MEKDRRKRNAKYGAMEADETPAEIVIRFAPMANKGGRALDIAAGCGRHALFLAGLGFGVDAVDISEVGLGRIKGGQAGVLLSRQISMTMKSKHGSMISSLILIFYSAGCFR